MESFRDKLANILEVDEVKDDDVLREMEFWDSLSVLSIQAMIEEDYGVALSAADLEPVRTFADLVALVNGVQSP